MPLHGLFVFFYGQKKKYMKIAVVGTGYVGLVTGTCFAEIGVDVVCVDIDAEKIARIERGDIPIYEPGLDEMVLRNMKAGRLRFTTDLSTCLDGVEILFSAVGTPPDEDGSADLHYVLDVAHTVGRYMNDYLVVVTKSTVPVGTARKVKAAIQSELDKRGVSIEFDVASNPEFLKEGNAIADFMRPDRVVVGVESKRAEALMQKLYKPFMINKYRIIITDIPSAEMIKYAANAMLATRISFMNEIALLCDEVGADVVAVRVYDPVAMPECRRRIGDRVEYAENIYEAVAGVDALLIVTEWKEFRMPDWDVVLRAMKSPVIFDGRNIYDPAEMKELGFVYRSIGRPLH